MSRWDTFGESEWDDAYAKKTVGQILDNLKLAKKLQKERAQCPDKKKTNKKKAQHRQRQQAQRAAREEKEDGTPVLLSIKPLEEVGVNFVVRQSVPRTPSSSIQRRGSLQSLASALRRQGSAIVRRGSTASSSFKST